MAGLPQCRFCLEAACEQQMVDDDEYAVTEEDIAAEEATMEKEKENQMILELELDPLFSSDSCRLPRDLNLFP